ncbi:MAG: bifunctional phosphopantothenoylcysteine decarboxylase/phosphopantothenate--cysteine ligase CoaBC, partial [Pyrinomonadaceae bacterium]
WEHPSTRRNIDQLIADGVLIVDPEDGEMACKTIGPGRLADPDEIVSVALDILAAGSRRQVSDRNDPNDSGDMCNERILITAGATREEIDPVRFISNRSSGRMGFAIAEAARSRGAEVTVIAGITTAPVPQNIHLINVTSTEEMHRAVMEELQNSTMFIAAAAVSDYRPAENSVHKIKRTTAPLVLTLEANPDILQDAANLAATNGWREKGLLLIGFAAETEDILKNGWSKLRKKNVDLMVINDITQSGAGFDTSTNIISIISRASPEPIEFPLMSKLDAAHRILEHAVGLRAPKSKHG